MAAIIAVLVVWPASSEQETQAVMSTTFWSSERWNDGRAEIAFYELHIPQSREPVLAGSILAKHRLDRDTLLKVGADDPEGEEAWHWIFLYGLQAPTAGPTRRFFALDARRGDLQPWRFRAAESSWNGNCGYQVSLDEKELALHESGSSCETLLPLADLERSHPYEHPTYLRSQMLLLVRGLDFRRRSKHEIALLAAGRPARARLELVGVERVRLPGGSEQAEKIAVVYSQAPRLRADAAPPGLFGTAGRREIYWRSTGANRQILKMEGEGYGLTLIEELRAKHWKEDFYPRLERVRRYP